MSQDDLIIAGKAYSSRLLIGTGKYKDFDETRRAIDESGAEEDNDSVEAGEFNSAWHKLEEHVVRDLVPAALGFAVALDAEKRLLVVPLVERLGLVEPLVAGKAQQLPARRARQRHGDERMAHGRGTIAGQSVHRQCTIGSPATGDRK